MDTLDAKLIAERDRLVALLSGIANALRDMSPERLAEVLPAAVGIDDVVRRVRRLRVAIPVTYPEITGDPSFTGPHGGAGFFGNPE